MRNANKQSNHKVNLRVVDYWINHYIGDGGCVLCGSHGVIDTRMTAKSARRGVLIGRLDYCLCPNGQTLRKDEPNFSQTDFQGFLDSRTAKHSVLIGMPSVPGIM